METPLKVLFFIILALIFVVILAIAMVGFGADTGTALDNFFKSITNLFPGLGGYD